MPRWLVLLCRFTFSSRCCSGMSSLFLPDVELALVDEDLELLCFSPPLTPMDAELSDECDSDDSDATIPYSPSPLPSPLSPSHTSSVPFPYPYADSDSDDQ